MARLESALSLSAPDAARRLLGAELTREINGQTCRVRIVETEAYDVTDAASHSSNGLTARTAVMFGAAGRAYVYFTYGMHYCFNIVTGKVGEGSAVLIRAVEPLAGEAVMSTNRGNLTGVALSNGPAKLCQSLQIDKTFYGHNLELPPFSLTLRPALPDSAVTQTTRIGISKAVDTPWRFYETGNPYVSKL
ncbi:MAG: DNA-3-methyladenine glycosylase [Patescibacteria group bacterium]|nr:DNA-3-methyladenine glycosylase [Patescibacteria group bacterium]